MIYVLLTYLALPIWFALPGIVANICPGFARKLPGGTIPVSKRILGPNKTWMALPTAFGGALIVSLLQTQLSYPRSYPDINWSTIAICFGLGAPLGDWSKSLLKRQFGIEPGNPIWLEKYDFLLMSYLFFAIGGIYLPIAYYLAPLILMAVVHGPGNRLSYQLGWRNSPH